MTPSENNTIMKNMTTYVTVREYADAHGLKYNSVYQAIKRGNYPDARRKFGRVVLPIDAERTPSRLAEKLPELEDNNV